jgi:hypothetical protein
MDAPSQSEHHRAFGSLGQVSAVPCARWPLAPRHQPVAGLPECPLPDVPTEPGFPGLVVVWLTDPNSWKWFPPPLTGVQIAAIYQHLVAREN